MSLFESIRLVFVGNLVLGLVRFTSELVVVGFCSSSNNLGSCSLSPLHEILSGRKLLIQGRIARQQLEFRAPFEFPLTRAY